jgi:hypothetical protein
MQDLSATSDQVIKCTYMIVLWVQRESPWEEEELLRSASVVHLLACTRV